MKNLAERDQAVIWHPLTQHYMVGLPLPIVKGEGAYLFDQEGKRYLDYVSSWWVNIHGHCEPTIAKAIYDQAMTLEHVIFAGITHEPAVTVAEKLLELLPSGFSKVFYSDNGSTSVEIALKMAFQYWKNKGEDQRKRFVAFEMGYHGDTLGAMSLGKSSHYNSNFQELLFPVHLFPYPATWINDENVLEKEALVLDAIQKYFAKNAHEIAAVVIEPLIQGASGMHMCRPEFLREFEKIVRLYGVLIIYDEVMTGFGRTGEFFACTKSETLPDMICLAKGLTGGFLPLAATVCQEHIYAAFLADSYQKSLAHSHSFTANPLGCAAASASLDLLMQPETLSKIQLIEKIHSEELTKLSQISSIEKLRFCGTIAAFDLKSNEAYGSKSSLAWRQTFLDKGLLIRPLGNVVYLMPPYCISELDLRQTYRIIAEEIQGVTHVA